MPPTSSAPILTLSIPTYNRAEQLAQILSVLAPQLDERTLLRIVDNASQVPAAQVVANSTSAEQQKYIDVVRNRCNVGGNPNLMRCFELCDSEWLWIMGDDDLVHHDAVAKAHAAIAKHSDATLINFTITRFPRSQASVATGVEGFLNNVRYMDTVVYTPNDLFRVAYMRESIKVGCLYTYTWMPHVVVLISSLKPDSKVVFLPDSVVDTAPTAPITEQYSAVSYCMGAGMLIECVSGTQARQKLAALLLSNNDFLFKAVFHMALSRARGVPFSVVAFQIDQIYHRWVKHAKQFKFSATLTASKVALLFAPALFAKGIISVAKKARGKVFSLNDLPDSLSRM